MVARRLCVLVASLALAIPTIAMVGCDEGQKSPPASGNTGADRTDREHNATGTGQATGNPSDIGAATAPTTQPEGVPVSEQGK